MAVDPVTGAVLGWLVGEIGAAGKSGLVRIIRGESQRNALRQIVQDAVLAVTKDVTEGHVLREALLLEAPDGLRTQSDPIDLLNLRSALARRMGPTLESLGEQGYFFDAGPLTESLASRVLVGIQADAVRSGPLAPLAEFLRHEKELDLLRGIKNGIDRLSGIQAASLPSGQLGKDGGLTDGAGPFPRREEALKRAQGAAHLDGAVRVQEVTPRQLGVHRAIEVAGAHSELPAYVARDNDGIIRSLLDRAARRSGFVLLVGGPSVGKKRSLYEAIMDRMPDWWLLHVDRSGQLDELSGENLERVVIWLDDLRLLLSGANDLSGGTIRRLLQAGQVVLVGTWSSAEYLRYTQMPKNAGSYAVERDLLALAEVEKVPHSFSHTELVRARELARTDPQIRAALKVSDFGVTQVMAGAPQLMDCWQNADPYTRAIVMAAVDAVLLGVRSPLPVDLLRAAAPAYCRGRERADAGPDWFETALARATTKLQGEMSLLIPMAPRSRVMGQIAGYTVADYLLQQTAEERTTAIIPAELWAACRERVDDPADLTRLGESAEERRAYEQANLFYRAAATDNPRAAYRLARLLAAEGRDDDALRVLLSWATAPGTEMADLAALLLRRTGRAEDLRTRAYDGDSAAASELVKLLVSTGQERELLAPSGLWNRPGIKAIVYHLAEVLAQRGRTDEAVAVLRPHVSAGDWDAADQLAGLLLAAERIEEALDVLRDYAGRGHHDAASKLAVLLAGLGREEELRARADQGDWPAAVQYAALLASAGREAELAARADAGDRPADYRLAYLLRQQGREDELRARADKGNKPALYQLSDLLAATGRRDQAIDLLKPLADDGDDSAASRLISLLHLGRR